MRRDLSCMGFNLKAGEIFPDTFILRFKLTLQRHGFHFANGIKLSADLSNRIATDISSVSKVELKSTGYPFLADDVFALNKLQKGHKAFSTKETEALETVYGDFFDIEGMPRNRAKNNTASFKCCLKVPKG